MPVCQDDGGELPARDQLRFATLDFGPHLHLDERRGIHDAFRRPKYRDRPFDNLRSHPWLPTHDVRATWRVILRNEWDLLPELAFPSCSVECVAQVQRAPPAG